VIRKSDVDQQRYWKSRSCSLEVQGCSAGIPSVLMRGSVARRAARFKEAFSQANGWLNSMTYIGSLGHTVIGPIS